MNCPPRCAIVAKVLLSLHWSTCTSVTKLFCYNQPSRCTSCYVRPNWKWYSVTVYIPCSYVRESFLGFFFFFNYQHFSTLASLPVFLSDLLFKYKLLYLYLPKALTTNDLDGFVDLIFYLKYNYFWEDKILVLSGYFYFLLHFNSQKGKDISY